MKFKLFITMVVLATLTGLAAIYSVVNKRGTPSATELLPESTLFYSGTTSPVKIGAALTMLDLEKVLQTELELSDEASRSASEWVRSLRGVHVGFNSVTLIPFQVDAAVILDGKFDTSLPEIVLDELEGRLKPLDPYRDILISRMVVKVHPKLPLELFITAPVKDRVLIGFSKQTVRGMVDRMLDGGPSLAQNETFIELSSHEAHIQGDTLQYIDAQAALSLLRSWMNMVPSPQVKDIINTVCNEFRLSDFGPISTRYDAIAQTSTTFQKVVTENPLYQQLAGSSLAGLPVIPIDATEFTCCQVADPEKAVRQIGGMLFRLGNKWGQQALPVKSTATLTEIGKKLAPQLTGKVGWWKRTIPGCLDLSCYYVEVKDIDRITEVLRSISELTVYEVDGVFHAEEVPFVWVAQDGALFIGTDPEYVTTSAKQQNSSLTQSAEFIELAKKLPASYSMISYQNWAEGMPVKNNQVIPEQWVSALTLFKGFKKMEVSTAEEGLFNTHAAMDFHPDIPSSKTIIQELISSVSASSFSDPEPEFLLSENEAFIESVTLLSHGDQPAAEELLDRALRAYPNDYELLFARGVLKRSRWSKMAAAQYFYALIRQYPESVYAKAAILSLQLDRSANKARFDALIRLSDNHPADVYLLWLSAMQCREQKDGIKGNEQYKKLLSKFDIGPVLLHQTYANILTEYLDDYDEALKHRKLAVQLSPKGWTYQGLANTLSKMNRYDESCDAWEKATDLDPDDSKYFRQWGGVLYDMDKYEEALEKYQRAAGLNPKSAEAFYWMAYCNLKLKQHDDLYILFYKAVELGHDYAVFEVGRCHQYGWGTPVNLAKAVEWYERAATAGVRPAQRQLGDCYAKAIGVAQDWREAAKWYHMAAEQNDTTALLMLGDCYKEGNGTQKDLDKARACYEKILKNKPNHSQAKKRLAQLKKEKSVAQKNRESVSQNPVNDRVRRVKTKKEVPSAFHRTIASTTRYAASGDYSKGIAVLERSLSSYVFTQEESEALQKRLEEFREKAATQESGK